MRSANSNSTSVFLIVVMGLVSSGTLVNNDILENHSRLDLSSHRKAKIVETTVKEIEHHPEKHSLSSHSSDLFRDFSKPNGETKVHHSLPDHLKMFNELIEEAGRTAVGSKYEKNQEKGKSNSRWEKEFDSEKGSHDGQNFELKKCLKEKDAMEKEIIHLKRQNNFQDQEIRKLTQTTSEHTKELKRIQNNLREAQLEIQNLKAHLHRQQTSSKVTIESLEKQVSHCKSLNSKDPKDISKLREKVFELEIDVMDCRARTRKLEQQCPSNPSFPRHPNHDSSLNHAHNAHDSLGDKHRTKVLLGSSIVSDLY